MTDAEKAANIINERGWDNLHILEKASLLATIRKGNVKCPHGFFWGVNYEDYMLCYACPEDTKKECHKEKEERDVI